MDGQTDGCQFSLVSDLVGWLVGQSVGCVVLGLVRLGWWVGWLVSL